MKFLIAVSALAVILCQGICFSSASPFPNYKVNELRESDNDSESPLLSSEIMPGRHLTNEEVRNLIYLAREEHGSKIWPLPEDKKMKTVSRTKRFLFRRSAARREERLRQRAERRRLRLERQRIRQEAQLQRLSFQNEATKHRLQQLSLTNKLQPLNLKVATTSIPTTTTSTSKTTTTQSSVSTFTAGTSAQPSTTGISTSRTTTITASTKPVEALPAIIAQTFKQVPLPSGAK